MKAAFSYQGTRIAPVFDIARQIRVVETKDGGIVSETDETLVDDAPIRTLELFTSLGIGTLICGAISRPLEEMLVASDIRVVSFVAGEIPEVVDAWLHDGLLDEAFAMPGCCGRRKRSRDGRGPGQGRGFGGVRRGGGARPGAVCICPACGHSEPHQRGVPCFEVRCAKCGTAMVRQFN